MGLRRLPSFESNDLVGHRSFHFHHPSFGSAMLDVPDGTDLNDYEVCQLIFCRLSFKSVFKNY